MLSYQHAYHAGNAADLHKHIALAELIARLTVKSRGLTYVETHAGRGLYDLAGPEARKTGETARGIARLAPDPATPYGMAVAAVRARHGASAYPGSPLVARALLRPQDRLVLHELHPAEHAALAFALPAREAAVPPAAIHRRDGFEGTLALAPPEPRRGLVLVDPSYEVKTDYAAAATFVRKLLARWPEAVVLAWYPLLAAGRHEALLAGLRSLPIRRDEVGIAGAETGMTGSGLVLVNGPHGSARALEAPRAQAGGILLPTARRPQHRPARSKG
jgi:23S rRNA (adenine2030-N6)-methyltransferase